MKKITTKTKIGDLLKENPDKAEMLMDAGMGCVFCPMSQQETIGEGCEAHGMSKKDVDKLLEELNKK